MTSKDPPDTIDTIEPDFDAPVVMEIKEMEHKQGLQTVFLNKVINLFIYSNIFIWILLLLCWFSDYSFISAGSITAAERVVDSSLLMALVGGTVAQLGTVFWFLSKIVFKKLTD